jgi:hypothetical protein
MVRREQRHRDVDVLTDIEYLEEAFDPARGTLFVIHGDMRLIDADFYLLPTDTAGRLERSWQRLWDLDPEIAPTYATDDAQLIETSRGLMLVPCDVGGSSATNTVDGLMGRFQEALILLAAWIATGDPSLVKRHHAARAPERESRRARPLLAMPLIGTSAGGLGRSRGEVIRALLDNIEEFLEDYEGRGEAYDIVLVCRSASDYAAVQHVRRKRIDLGLEPPWLYTLVEHAKRGRLAALFGAGVSAAAGVPLWSDLLDQLAARFEMPEETAQGLSDLDPTDAATLLAERATAVHGSEGPRRFQEALQELVGLDRATLTQALLANMRLSVAITTNYDQGYELAIEGMGIDDPVVLPWDRNSMSAGPLIMKLHGDVDRGLIVLSREDFVAMHAFRRPLAGVLQDQMLSGHVLIVGSSMSDPTLVHAAEEVAGLLRQVSENAVDGGSAASVIPGGTLLMGNPHPARQEILSRSLTVVMASQTKMTPAITARRIDIVLDLINCLASQDLSFALDSRYSDLLSPSEKVLADDLRRLAETLGPDEYASPLQEAVTAFLRGLGGR